MFKVEFLRFIKIPMNMFFAFLLPIALMILFAEFLDESVFKVNFVPLVLLTTVATTIMPISINVCMDKVSKRTKHYVIIPGAMSRYIGSLFLTIFIIAEITSVVLILIGTLAYKVEVAGPNIAMLILAPPLSFVLGFSISIIIARYVKSFEAVLPLANVVFLLVMFLSGMTVPLQLFAKDYFYYIQVLTPQGILIMLYNHIEMSANPIVGQEQSILDTTQLAIAGTVLSVYTVGLVSWSTSTILKGKLV